VTAKPKRQAIIRLSLGFAQVMGATASAYLLIKSGVNMLTIAATAVTLAFALTSRMLFGRREYGP